MAKLCVVVTGLAALVPPIRTDPTAKVLLRKVDAGTRVGATEILPHRPLLRFRTGPGPAGLKDRELVAGETVTFTPAAPAGPVIRKGNQFLKIGDDLTRPSPAKAIFRNGGADPILGGRIVLTGGSVSPVQLDDILNLRQVHREITTELRGAKSLDNSRNLDTQVRPTANGFLFERELADGETPQIRIDGEEPRELVAAPQEELGFLGDSAAPVYVVWAVNISRRTALPAPTQRVFRMGLENKGPLFPLGFDPDFHLLYDFVDGSATPLVPLLFDPERPGDPPGRCMPGVTG